MFAALASGPTFLFSDVFRWSSSDRTVCGMTRAIGLAEKVGLESAKTLRLKHCEKSVMRKGRADKSVFLRSKPCFVSDACARELWKADSRIQDKQGAAPELRSLLPSCCQTLSNRIDKTVFRALLPELRCCCFRVDGADNLDVHDFFFLPFLQVRKPAIGPYD